MHFDLNLAGYQLRNAGRLVRGWKQELLHLADLGTVSSLHGKIIRANGRVENKGLLGRRVVTTAGVNYLAACFTNTNEPELFNFHDAGTGIVAEATTDTALGTPWGGSRVSGTQSLPGSVNIYQTVATITFTGTFAITEHGIFSASTAGTLLDRTKFSALNVNNGDSIQFTYQITFNAGG